MSIITIYIYRLIRNCLFQLKQCLTIPYVAFAIYTSIVITTGVLVICLTAKEKGSMLFCFYCTFVIVKLSFQFMQTKDNFF
jgi:hypothetical protein